MEKISTLGKGDRARLNVLLEPIYGLDNEMICHYQSSENIIEFTLHPDDLMKSPDQDGKMMLSKALIVENVRGDLVICRIEGSHRMLSIPKKDLMIQEVDENLFDL